MCQLKTKSFFQRNPARMGVLAGGRFLTLTPSLTDTHDPCQLAGETMKNSNRNVVYLEQREKESGIFIASGADFGSVTDASDNFADMLGLSTEQIVGSSTIDYTPDAFEKDFFWARDALLAAGDSPLVFYKCFEYITGAWIPVKITAVCLKDLPGAAICLAQRIAELPFPKKPKQPYQNSLANKVRIFRPK